MQHRMKEFTMTDEAVNALLDRAQVGRISTVGADGYPYTVSVHYWYDGKNIYFHGLPKGEKLDNIAANPKVCFEVSELKSIMNPGNENDVCTADAEYESAVIRGTAEILADREQRKEILCKIVEKYLPGMKEYTMPEKRIDATAVVQVKIENVSGKYHR